MKELDSFTVERLEEIRNSFLDRIQEKAPSIGEVFALIDIALAAKRAEPVAWLLSGGGAKNIVTFDSGNAYIDPLREVTPLYTTPQLNSPEIRKLILSEVSDFCAGLGQPGEPELPEDIQQALMNRIELVFNNCG